MDDRDPGLNRPGSGEEDTQPSYTPASPTKRALAWMGVAYMLILVALNTYGLATGSPLTGIAGIMLAPACFTLAVVQVLKFRGLRREHLPGCGALFLAVLGAAVGLYSLVDGLRSLLIQLGG